MNKYLLTLLSWSALAVAQTGPQPLHFSNITFFPQGCDTGATFNLKATASGGTPAADGTYTYQLEGQPSQVAQVAQFNGVTADFDELPLIVTDANNTSVTYVVRGTPSQSGSVSMSIDSLPLGDGPGCITLSITDPNPVAPPVASFSMSELGETPGLVSATQEPFKRTFSAFASSKDLTAICLLSGDCSAGTSSDFRIQFPFPQGLGNAMKKYLFNKYCSCALLSSTVPAEQA